VFVYVRAFVSPIEVVYMSRIISTCLSESVFESESMFVPVSISEVVCEGVCLCLSSSDSELGSGSAPVFVYECVLMRVCLNSSQCLFF